jgi:hypothetical protein
MIVDWHNRVDAQQRYCAIAQMLKSTVAKLRSSAVVGPRCYMIIDSRNSAIE